MLIAPYTQNAVTPVLGPGLVIYFYGLSHRNRGEYVALNMPDGRVLWKSPPRQGDYAAVLLLGDWLLLLSTEAALAVVRADPKAFAEVRRYTVADSPTWAHPLLLPGGIVLKDATSAIYWRLP